jgi:hypothetical protein
MKKNIFCGGWRSEIKLKEKNTLKLPAETDSYVVHNDRYIVLFIPAKLKRKKLKSYCKNIWCYNSKGELLWKIQENKKEPEWPLYYEKWAKKELAQEKEYISVRYEKESGHLLARTWGGYYELDPETGKISNYVADMRKTFDLGLHGAPPPQYNK